MPFEEFKLYYKSVFRFSESRMAAFEEAIREPLPSAFRISETPFKTIIKKRLEKYSSFVRRFEPLGDVYIFALRAQDERYSEFVEFLVAMSDIGAVQRQEVVSMLPFFFMAVSSGMSVLETCAAPGSKTKQMLEVLRDGILVSNDRSYSRLNILVSEASKKAFPGFIATHSDAVFLPFAPGTRFDRVCCDVPCSSDGTLKKNFSVAEKWLWTESISLSALQLSIVRKGLALIKDDGLLLYSTCSLNPVENEYVVSKALESGEYEVVAPEEVCGEFSSKFSFVETSHGETERAEVKRHRMVLRRGIARFDLLKTLSEAGIPLAPDSESKPRLRRCELEKICYDNADLGKCARALPDDQNIGGFFIAVIRRKEKGKSVAENSESAKNHRFALKETPDDILSSIEEKYRIDSQKYRYFSLTDKQKSIYCVSNAAYEFIKQNPRLNVCYAGVKAFIKTEFGDRAYRVKSGFLDSVPGSSSVHASWDDFIRLVSKKDVPVELLSFTTSGHFAMSVDGMPCRFSGFYGRTSAFLYLDDQRRKALRLLYDISHE